MICVGVTSQNQLQLMHAAILRQVKVFWRWTRSIRGEVPWRKKTLPLWSSYDDTCRYRHKVQRHQFWDANIINIITYQDIDPTVTFPCVTYYFSILLRKAHQYCFVDPGLLNQHHAIYLYFLKKHPRHHILSPPVVMDVYTSNPGYIHGVRHHFSWMRVRGVMTSYTPPRPILVACPWSSLKWYLAGPSQILHGSVFSTSMLLITLPPAGTSWGMPSMVLHLSPVDPLRGYL